MKTIAIGLVAVLAVCARPSDRAAARSAGSSAASPATSGRPGMMGGAMGGMAMMGGARADTSAAPSPSAAHADSTADCPPVDQALVNRGRAVFSSAGNCFACHGPDARGTAIAPDLTDAQWLDIDGSYAAIATLVRTGVPKPKVHAAPMPAMGGATLSGAQICAVAAYVYSLGQR